MCGRYQLDETGLEFIPRALSAVWRREPGRACYNIAPTMHAPVVIEAEGRRVIDLFRWGLIPGWAKDASIGNRMINARAETIVEKPAYRGAFRARRCLVPAAGFYEWQRTPQGKQPHHIHPRHGILTFAGLWESWRPEPDVEPVLTFTILTTAANGFMSPIHDRMPVLLEADGRDAWLSPHTPGTDLRDLLRPAPEDCLAAYPVSTQVNSPANDSAELIAPLAE